MKTRQMKINATKAEYKRVYENMNLPARNIEIPGWIKPAWNCGHNFGWRKWERYE
jgi:hypothetical protein